MWIGTTFGPICCRIAGFRSSPPGSTYNCRRHQALARGPDGLSKPLRFDDVTTQRAANRSRSTSDVVLRVRKRTGRRKPQFPLSQRSLGSLGRAGLGPIKICPMLPLEHRMSRWRPEDPFDHQSSTLPQPIRRKSSAGFSSGSRRKRWRAPRQVTTRCVNASSRENS